MEQAIKTPNARQQVEAAYTKMLVAYDRYFHCSEDQQENFKIDYTVALNNYRDTCTVVVERLLRTNPKVLEDLTLLWLA